MVGLVLYGTQGCHLCDIAEQLVASTLDLNVLSVELVDIAYDDQLIERYAVRIPVIMDIDSGAELGWPFDIQRLTEFVAKAAIS
tara:strand:+ start:1548 stop:1799 length:252 start_codon:yes stop_codon:yes gene_type:complete